MKIFKGIYVALIWIYGIAVVGFIAMIPAIFAIEFLSDIFPLYEHLLNLQNNFIVELFSGFLFIFSFFLFYIPTAFLLIFPLVLLNEKLKIDTGL